MPVQQVIQNDATGRPLAAVAKIWTHDIDENALEQLRALGTLPFVFKHVAVMPDVHAGKGSTIGSVLATKGAITPATVGVDLGCGMSAYKIPGLRPEDLDGKLLRLRKAIEKAVPVGQAVHKHNEGLKILRPAESQACLKGKEEVLDRAWSIVGNDRHLGSLEKVAPQMGTLGGGNHFIEVCVSKKNEVWLLLHSGSRGVGNMIAQHHINIARGLMKKAFIELPNADLAYFLEGTPEFEHYISDMLWAQEFAYLNRRAMGRLVLNEIIALFDLRDARGSQLKADALTFVDCHHNYVARETHFGEDVWVTRKGAVRAFANDLGIIPGSMGARSFIVKGRGEEESFCSCSHGAGRRLSRTRARELYSEEDLIRQTAGIECRKDDGVLDEIPAAYKNIDEVMENQSDLVEVVEELRQLICVKG
ncbi:RtcB family protein [Oligoflexus tunisiensis]|uniref:RtcB family protein n=1 Tax=Oligoflexus tunisiensis TaxID=708132 RepID=UPI000A78F180|nr:RtcB family protein [Oligoflexus tunisiensis]